MKRIFGLFLGLVCTLLLIGAATNTVSAATVGAGTCGDDVVWTLDDMGVLSIYGSGPMDNYTNYTATPWYTYSDEITSAVIEDGVTSIGKYALGACQKMKSVSIPGSVSSIGERAFYICHGLTDVTIPNGVTSIGKEAFYFCQYIKTISLPSTLTNIADGAFYGCDSLAGITIPNGITAIGNAAFRSCGDLASLTIPSTVKTIGKEAFYFCESLTTLTIPASVKTINDEAFAYCRGLDVITFKGDAPNFVDDGDGVNKTFYEVGAVAYYPANNSTWTAEKRQNYSGSLNWVTIYPCGDNVNATLDGAGTLTISGTGPMWTFASSTDVPWYSQRTSIRKVAVESGVTSVGRYAFSDCTSMTAVSLPSGITLIDELSFSGCAKLSSITIPSGVTRIGKAAFYCCVSLTDITIPDSVTVIGDSVFLFCNKLNSVVLPKNITTIGNSLFSGCYSLTDVTIPNGVTSIGESAFAVCIGLTEITIPANVSSIGAQAFSGCDLLSAITFKGNAPTFGTDVFSSLTATVYYPSNNSTWTSDKLQNYGGTITWQSYLAELNAPTIAASNDEATGKPKISWSKVTGADKYDLYRATSKSGTYTKIGTTTGTSIINKSAVTGKQYYYKVKAVSNEGIVSSYSNIVNRTCDLPRPVVTVTNVASTGKVKLSWTAIDGAEQYELYRATSKTGTYSKIGSTSKNYITNTSAEAGKTYYYKVKAIHSNSAATSAYSAVVYRTCDLPQPVVTASNVASTGKVKLSWKAITGATKYEVYWATSKTGTYSKLTTVTGTSVTNTSAKTGTTYYYKVKAIHSSSAADSAYSEIVSRTCDLPQPAVTATNVSSTGKVKLSWKAIDGATKYELYRATSKSGTYSKIGTTTGTSITNTSGAGGKTYYYKVKAIHSNSGANSAYSEIVTRTCDLAQPTVTATNVSSTGKIKLSWKAVEGATKYEVYRATTKSGTYSKVTTVTGTSVTNTSAVAGKGYYYKVRALCDNSAATSVYSAVVSRTCDLAQPSVTATNVSSTGKIKLSWKAVEGATKYEVYWASSKDGSYTRIATVTGTSVTNNSAKVGKMYYYKVRALCDNSAATSVYSTIVNRTCDLAQPVLTVGLSEKGIPTLSWDAVSGATKYEIYRATSKDGTYNLIDTVDATFKRDNDTAAGKTYYYKIRALCSNSAATSVYSVIKSVTVK